MAASSASNAAATASGGARSAQSRHAMHGIHRIDQSLGGECGDTALDMDCQRADSENRATAAPSAPVAGSRTRMDQVMSAILAAQPTCRKPVRLGGTQSRVPIATDLILLGAGHAHVEVLRRFAMRPQPGVRLTLIGREPETPYTGMLPGLIRGD